ncbi:UvrD-helicase domain-containing protein [Cyanobium sp. Morenito 9A2]|uniref:UvrD-helicase domain-containing protein n=1 Tax=Cyanobium sp. Morenito 9A2 TaxID=2823718 RepID=UPI0020CD6A2E|nr:UvrD-helicase domain-containing protein [Cyanobium sp. Morenito 9A2]
MGRFDADTFSLGPGVRLLEASAGTGKTFTLAHLVLRLVLERGLPLGELLVVTFTNAAAAELRDRIGRRLQQALTVLEQADQALRTFPDPVLERWFARQPMDHAGRRQLMGRLLLALDELDRADITTLHGFSQRSLRRQALEAALAPEVELDPEARILVRQVAHDYWQAQVVALPVELLAGAQSLGVTPKALEDLLAQLESDTALELDPVPLGLDPSEPLAPQLVALWQQRWSRFQELWTKRGEGLYEALKSSAARWRAEGFDPKPYAAKPSNDWMGGINAWLATQPEQGSYASLLEQNALRNYFHPGPFSAAARRAGETDPSLPERPLLLAIADLVEGPAEALLLHAAHWGRSELARRRQSSGRLGYAQLLEGLDPGPEGEEHAELLEALGRRYRVALVDEFQDTDPIQWRILQRAFTGPEHLLLMVGDPKQAIYRFRGGDLDTYRAARVCADSVSELSENFRSSEALIASLNALMGAVGLAKSNLPVPQVRANPAKAALHALELPAGESPLQLLWLAGELTEAETLTLGEIDALLPAQVAQLVLDLLRRGLNLREGEASRPLAPSDIALLVNKHREAEALRQALEHRGIASRLVSQGDVFASEGATVLQRLLAALADPGNGAALRLLAATPLLGWSGAQLAGAQGSGAGPGSLEALSTRISHLVGVLERDGLLAVLGDLLGSAELAGLSLGGGLLADLQQAAQLLQEQMHREGLGPAAALDWLRRQRLEDDGPVPDAHQRHSDAVSSAVAVVTVHSSKGLEYPVVITPTLWRGLSTRSGQGLGRRWRPPNSGGSRWDLHLNGQWGTGFAARAQARAAEAQELERLAYVAATRACDLLVLVWAPAGDPASDPLRPWLFGRTRGGTTWREGLAEHLGASGLQLQLIEPAELPAPASPADRWQPPALKGALTCGPVPHRALDRRWGRSSYSSWTQGAAAALGPIALEEGRETDGAAERMDEGEGIAGRMNNGAAAVSPAAPASGQALAAAPVARPAWPERGPLADFPRGAAAGDGLHRILEQFDHQRPAGDEIHRQLVRRELERAGLPTTQLEAVLEGMEWLRLTPMGGALGRFALADLPRRRCLNELNFDLPLAVPLALAKGQSAPLGAPRLVSARGLAQVFANHPGGRFGAAYAERLAQLEVASRGFLTGSIDLLFTAPDAQGHPRWWVADWKSNWIGVRDGENRPLACGPAHYTEAAMEQQMLHHHYPLQAHLYLVALHRYLRWRLPGYQPERDLGGYVYVFLRGVAGPTTADPVPGMLVDQPPLERLLALDQLLREGSP